MSNFFDMKRNLAILLLTTLALVSFQKTTAQSFAINTDGSTASSSSILDVKSTDKGILIPRMTKAQKNAIASPAAGLMIYQISPDSTGFHYFDGTRWNWLSFMNAVDTLVWKTSGNTGTDTARHFIGTKDAMPLRFKQNNVWIGQFNANRQNYLIGRGTGQRITTGTANTAFGDSSLTSLISQGENTAFGYRALKRVTQQYNSAFGAYALENNLSGYGNTALGYQSQVNTKNGYWNLSAGYYSLTNDTLGFWNTGLGAYSLYEGRSHQYNTAVGMGSLRFAGQNIGGPFDGGFNTAVGVQAGYNLVTGYSNTYIGMLSGSNQLTGIGNTAIGAYSLLNNRRGNGHIAVGYFSLYNDTSISVPNVAIGQTSLNTNISGNSNTAIGSYSGGTNVSGSRNTFVGAGTVNNNYSNTTTVGAYAMADTNNALILGSINGINGATADVNVGIGTTKPVHSLHVVNTNPNDGGWAQGIMVESTSPIATVGEAAVSFRNALFPAGRQWNVGLNQNTSLAFNYGSSFAGGNTRMVIDTLGNVGIGTITPGAKLHVRRGVSGGSINSQSAVAFEDDGQFFIQLSSNDLNGNGIISGNAQTSARSGILFAADSSIVFQTGGYNNRVWFKKDGKVGITTFTPNSTLDVDGSFANSIQIITGDVTLNQGDHTIIISSSVGASPLTITLPVASSSWRREYVIVNQNPSVKTISSYRNFSNTAVTTIPANSSITLQASTTLWYQIR